MLVYVAGWGAPAHDAAIRPECTRALAMLVEGVLYTLTPAWRRVDGGERHVRCSRSRGDGNQARSYPCCRGHTGQLLSATPDLSLF